MKRNYAASIGFKPFNRSLLRTSQTSRRRTLRTLAFASSCLVLLAVPTAGHAAKNQLSVIDDPARLLSADPITQDAALDEIRDLDADVVKLPVTWRSLAPRATSRKRPTGDLSDPATYGSAAWATIDRAIFGAALRGQKVWVMLTPPAPRWAVNREDAEAPGVLQPNPSDFADFVEAAGRHFASVKIWSLLNEPNLSLFMRPQFKNGVVVSAVHSRKMYRAGQAALKTAGHGADTILFGELLPRAPKPRRANGTTPPLLWLRDFFCLGVDLRPLTGTEARKRECNGFKPIKTSGFAYHPYTTPRGPLIDDDRPDSATIQHLGRVYDVLDAAYRHDRVTQRKMKIYSSEFGFQSAPPDDAAIPIRRIPEYLNVSEYLSYKDPRVASYSQYLLRDDLATEAFQSGLRFSDGSKKPGVYAAYTMPLVVVRRTATTVVVWGRLRDGTGAARSVELQGDAGEGFEKLATVRLSAGNDYFEKVLRGVSADGTVFRVKSGAHLSRKTKAGDAPAMLP